MDIALYEMSSLNPKLPSLVGSASAWKLRLIHGLIFPSNDSNPTLGSSGDNGDKPNQPMYFSQLALLLSNTSEYPNLHKIYMRHISNIMASTSNVLGQVSTDIQLANGPNDGISGLGLQCRDISQLLPGTGR